MFLFRIATLKKTKQPKFLKNKNFLTHHYNRQFFLSLVYNLNIHPLLLPLDPSKDQDMYQQPRWRLIENDTIQVLGLL